jgi:hypothetical protein
MKKRIVGKIVEFTFDRGLAPILFDTTKAHANMRETAMLKGFSHRLGDAAALDAMKCPGGVVTEQMRYDEVKFLADHYESGIDQWNVRAAGETKQNAVILALSVKLGKTYAETEAFLADDAVAELLAE